MISKSDKKISRRHATEKAVAQSLLGDFEVKNSRGLSIIESLMGENTFESMSRNSLLSLTTVLSKLTQIPFPRNFQSCLMVAHAFNPSTREADADESF